MPKILLVDTNDQPLGYEEKLKVHELGLLHRSFSIFIFNSQGELLIQKRAAHKYHSGGLWSNTGCSHQQAGESLNQAARRCLRQEMGLDCTLKESFRFCYNVKVSPDLTENELDHVFVGVSDKRPRPNPREVEDFQYINEQDLKRALQRQPENYTPWFKIIMEKFRVF